MHNFFIDHRLLDYGDIESDIIEIDELCKFLVLMHDEETWKGSELRKKLYYKFYNGPSSLRAKTNMVAIKNRLCLDGSRKHINKKYSTFFYEPISEESQKYLKERNENSSTVEDLDEVIKFKNHTNSDGNKINDCFFDTANQDEKEQIFNDLRRSKSKMYNLISREKNEYLMKKNAGDRDLDDFFNNFFNFWCEYSRKISLSDIYFFGKKDDYDRDGNKRTNAIQRKAQTIFKLVEKYAESSVYDDLEVEINIRENTFSSNNIDPYFYGLFKDKLNEHISSIDKKITIIIRETLSYSHERRLIFEQINSKKFVFIANDGINFLDEDRSQQAIFNLITNFDGDETIKKIIKNDVDSEKIIKNH